MATDHQIKCAFDLVEDARKVIAAGKTQRWDIVKWAIALNLAIPAAIIATKPGLPYTLVYIVVAACISYWATVLVDHVTRRMTGARQNAGRAYRYLEASQAYEKSMGVDDFTAQIDDTYDGRELPVYRRILYLSTLPALIVAVGQWLDLPLPVLVFQMQSLVTQVG